MGEFGAKNMHNSNLLRGICDLSLLLALTASLLFLSEKAFSDTKCSPIYAKVGAGYKFVEYKYSEFEYVSPYSARIDLAVDCGNLSFGISHHSQWLTGWPINNVKEPNKTEFFIDYKVYFW
jgi:hypothetical protein